MRRFLLVRHATAQEGPDSSLSDGGRLEARALARRLKDVALDGAWSSDLKRAAETAALILGARERPLPLQVSPLLREVDMPPSADAPDYAEREQDALDQLTANISLWLTLAEGNMGSAGSGPDQTILVVGHAGLLRVMVCRLLGLPAEEHWCFRLDRASLTVVERGDDMGTLTLLNDRCHLAGDEGKGTGARGR